MLQTSGAALVSVGLVPRAAVAAPSEPFKIGIVWSYTGGGPASGPELDGSMAAFQKLHGDTVAGRKIVIVRRDDTGVNPETARRMAQELVVQEKVDMIAGMILRQRDDRRRHLQSIKENTGDAGQLRCDRIAAQVSLHDALVVHHARAHRRAREGR